MFLNIVIFHLLVLLYCRIYLPMLSFSVLVKCAHWFVLTRVGGFEITRAAYIQTITAPSDTQLPRLVPRTQSKQGAGCLRLANDAASVRILLRLGIIDSSIGMTSTIGSQLWGPVGSDLQRPSNQTRGICWTGVWKSLNGMLDSRTRNAMFCSTRKDNPTI